jgi:hypothetical protein
MPWWFRIPQRVSFYVTFSNTGVDFQWASQLFSRGCRRVLSGFHSTSHLTRRRHEVGRSAGTNTNTTGLGQHVEKPSAPRLYSTSRLMRVALTSVHPGCGLHPVHPGCTSGYGDWWAGVLAGACSGLYACFFRPGGAGEGASSPHNPANLNRWRSISDYRELIARCLSPCFTVP